jgi:flagella basal body P-ring formation protein FlgA
MIRTLSSLLLLAALASPAAAQGNARLAASLATPTLKREVTVMGEIVRIGDLIDNAGPAAAKPIFRAPDLGQTGSIPAQRVLDAVLPHGLVLVDARGITDVVVTRSARVIDDVEARVARALASRHNIGDPKNLKIAFDRDVRPIELDPTSTGELSVSRLVYDPFSHRFDLTFGLVDGDNARRTWRYTGTALETVEVAIVTRSLARGETVRASDISIERRPKTEITGEAAAQPAEVVGLAARRAVRLGTALRTADLMKPDLVQRGEVVTLQYLVPGVTITLRGKALDGGAEGDTVSVLNVESKRTLQGIVAGPGRVVLNASPSRLAKADDTAH